MMADSNLAVTLNKTRLDKATTATPATEAAAEAGKLKPAVEQRTSRPSPPSGPLSRWQNRLRIASTRHLQVPVKKKINVKAPFTSDDGRPSIDENNAESSQPANNISDNDGHTKDAKAEVGIVSVTDELTHKTGAFNELSSSQQQQRQDNVNSQSNKTFIRFFGVKKAVGDAFKTSRDVDCMKAPTIGNLPSGSLHNVSLHSQSSTHSSIHGNRSAHVSPVPSSLTIEAPVPQEKDDYRGNDTVVYRPIAPDSGVSGASITPTKPLSRDGDIETNPSSLHPCHDCPSGLSIFIPPLPGPPTMTQPFPTTATHPSVEEAQRKLIAQLQTQCKLQSVMNAELKSDYESLAKRKQANDELHKSTVETLEREVEETALKLSVLEQHFCQLNMEEEKKRSVDMGLSGCTLPPSSSTMPRELAGSIIQVDKAYVTDLRNTAAHSLQELERVKKKLLDLQTKSERVEQGLIFEIEDLKTKVECREATIVTLEQALTQLRESRFNNHTKKKNENRSVTTTEVSGISSIADADTDGTDESSVISVSTASTIATIVVNYGTEIANVKTNAEQDTDLFQSKTAEAVGSAYEKQIKAHSDAVDELRDKTNYRLTSKDVIIAKLKNTVSFYQKEIKALKANGAWQPAEQHPTLFNLRSLAVTNEMLDASSRRLENMLKKVEERRQIPGALGQGYSFGGDEEDERQQPHASKIFSQADTDHKAQLLSVAEKIQIVQEELKVSMRLLEQRMKNMLESMREESNKNSNNAETGQYSGERTQTDTQVTNNSAQSLIVAERIMEVHEKIMKSIRTTELNISNQLKEFNDQTQTFRFNITAKQDIIESLEMACAEHDVKIRTLRHELDVAKSSTLSIPSSIPLSLNKDEDSAIVADAKLSPVVITSDDVTVFVHSDNGKDLASLVGTSCVVSDVEDCIVDSDSIGSLESKRSI